VVLQQVTETHALFFGNDGHQVEFDFVGVGVSCETESLRYAHDVSVHADGLPAEGVTENDIGRFSTDTGETY